MIYFDIGGLHGNKDSSWMNQNKVENYILLQHRMRCAKWTSLASAIHILTKRYPAVIFHHQKRASWVNRETGAGKFHRDIY